MNNIYDNLKYDTETDCTDSNSESNSESDSESDVDLDLELYVADSRGKMCIQPVKKILSKKQRLICYSTINGKSCIYGHNCVYAHSLQDQYIDNDKLFAYQVVLDNNLMEYYSITNINMINIYKKLMVLTNYCESSIQNKCSGGYNCKYGTHHTELKVCKNDFLMGDCRNKIIDIDINDIIHDKIGATTKSDKYIGCINGHHLSHRGFIPYYKFLHEKELQSRNKFLQKKCIDLDDVSRMINRAVITEESSDDDIDLLFDKLESDSEDNISSN